MHPLPGPDGERSHQLLALRRHAEELIVVHPWHQPRNRPTARPLTAVTPNGAAEQPFSEEDLVDLLSALRARAASHPDNPGLVAFWPAVSAQRMSAACGLLARRGHSVQPVTVALWDGERTRDGWTLGTPLHDLAPDIALPEPGR